MNETCIRNNWRSAVIATAAVLALLVGGSIADSAARADDVTVLAPGVVEPVAGQTETISVTFNWPGVPQDQLHVWWEYASAADSGDWPVISGRWGAEAESPGRLRLQGADVSQWDGWYVRAVAQVYQGGPVHRSTPILIRVLSVGPDLTVPADVSLWAGGNAHFRASAPTPPFTDVFWEKQSPGSTTWEKVQTNARAIIADLVVSNVAPGDNGTRYRPVFETERGVPHYGRVATLTVTIPGLTGAGVFFDPHSKAFRFYRDGVVVSPPTGVVEGFGAHAYYSLNGTAVFGALKQGSFDGYADHATGLVRDAFRSDGQGLRFYDHNGQHQRMPGTAAYLSADTYLYQDERYLIDDEGRSLLIRAAHDIGTPAYGGSVKLYVLEMPHQWLQIRAVVNKPGRLGLFSATTVRAGSESLTIPRSATAEQAAALINRTLGPTPQGAKASAIELSIDGRSDSFGLVCPRNLSGICPPPSIDELDLPGTHIGGVDLNPAADIAHAARVVLDELRAMTPEAVEQLVGDPAREYREWIRHWNGEPLTEAQLIQDLRYRTTLVTAVGERVGRPTMARVTAGVNGVFDVHLARMVTYFNTDETASLDDLAVILSDANRYLRDEETVIADDFREEVGHAIDRYTRVDNPRLLDYEQAAGEAYDTYVLNGSASAEALAAADQAEHALEEEHRAVEGWNEDYNLRATMIQILLSTPRLASGHDGFTFTLESLRESARASRS